jgi:hypothetical protein
MTPLQAEQTRRLHLAVPGFSLGPVCNLEGAIACLIVEPLFHATIGGCSKIASKVLSRPFS